MKPKDQTVTESMEPVSTEFTRFRNFAKQIISVPKKEIDKRQIEYEASRANKQIGSTKPKATVQPKRAK